MSRWRAAAVVVAVTVVVTGAVSVRPVQGASALVRIGAVPEWTGTDHSLGVPAPSTRLPITVYLRQPHVNDAERLAAAVSDPTGPQYRHFVSPDEYRARYAPSATAARTVVRYLSAGGLTVDAPPANRLFVRGTGTVGRIETLLHTRLGLFRHGGATVVAPLLPVAVPAAIAAVVDGVAGLVNGIGAEPLLRLAAPAVHCSGYTGEHTASMPTAYGRETFPTRGCGYSPAQIRRAYGTADLVDRGVDGRGTTVAVLLFFAVPHLVEDANRFFVGHGVAPLALGQLTQVLPKSFDSPSLSCSPDSTGQEAEGDVEMVHSMAPGARLVYVAASGCSPESVLSAINTTVDRRLADVVTNSYTLSYLGMNPSVSAAAHHAFLQAAAEGITFVFGSGDWGDNSPRLVLPQTTWPADDPLVTAVGGTSLFLDRDGRRLHELGWGTTLAPVLELGVRLYLVPPPGLFSLGSGGGRSSGFAQPDYQRGVVPASLAGRVAPRRVIPDVAMVADTATGVRVGVRVGGSYVEGPGAGTSVASPLFAGLQAIVDQQAGGPLGFVNPLLYRLRNRGVFHDIVRRPGPVAVAYVEGGNLSLDTLQDDTSLVAAPGYDDQTGLGSPDASAYAAVVAAR